jgi:hypothetical protein
MSVGPWDGTMTKVIAHRSAVRGTRRLRKRCHTGLKARGTPVQSESYSDNHYRDGGGRPAL